MKVCFPVIDDAGMESTIYGHFASAPLFVIIDTDTRHCSVIANCDRDNPLADSNWTVSSSAVSVMIQCGS
jgi:predicted Fe-Mo cluster-binding NifX family protein